MRKIYRDSFVVVASWFPSTKARSRPIFYSSRSGSLHASRENSEPSGLAFNILHQSRFWILFLFLGDAIASAVHGSTHGHRHCKVVRGCKSECERENLASRLNFYMQQFREEEMKHNGNALNGLKEHETLFMTRLWHDWFNIWSSIQHPIEHKRTLFAKSKWI